MARLTGFLLCLGFVAGCGGAGTEVAPQAPSATATNAPELTPEPPRPTGPPAKPDDAIAPKGASESATSTTAAGVAIPTSAMGRVVLASMMESESLLTLAHSSPSGKSVSEEAAKPADYLWQLARQAPQDEPLTVEVPKGLPPLTPGAVVPNSNPITKGKAELGKQLYFDPRISKDGTVACATCHNPDKGWTDQARVSLGIRGQAGGRSAPTVLNTVYGKTMFWDGRAPSLEGQSQGPPLNPIEMGNDDFKELVERLRAIPGYQEQFLKVFGTDVTVDGIAKAIATFERVAALSGNAPYDKYQGGELTALSESQKRGMVLFGLRLHPDDEFDVSSVPLKKANCTSCHVGFNFTDEQFHNLGVGWDETKKEFKDVGRWAIAPIGAKSDVDLGAFKTPTCRDLSRTAPYMHDGSEQTLRDVVVYYNKGGKPNPALDKDMKPLNLTESEIDDVVAFMKSLDGEVKTIELPKLPPGADGVAPDPAKALTPPAPTNAAARPAAHGIFTATN
jgi:cytochrome c peroxidase